MRRTIWLVALVAFGCGSPPRSSVERLRQAERPPPHNLAGCYALYDEADQPASKSLYYASDRVRLDTMVASGQPNTWRVARLDGNGRTPADARGGGSVYWAADSLAADTIHVMIHTGHSGSELILGVRPGSPDTLRGRALEHWDMGPSTTEAGRATAVRVACVHGGG